MIIEKEISQLIVGNFVVDIVKQKGTFSLNAAGHIKSQNVISNLLKKGVLSVLIDTDKTIETSTITHDVSSEKVQTLDIRKAKKLFTQSKLLQKKIINNIVNNTEIDLAPINEVIDETISIASKNPDALTCILNIRNKNEYLFEHSIAVSILMTIFSHHLKLDQQIIQQLAIGGFLHDVGKVKIPSSVLLKPGKLTPNEFTVMKSHVAQSIKITENIKNISEVSLEVVALHHEKLDGSGYPYGLSDDRISIYGRMIAICDIFDTLVNDREYKEGFSHIKSFGVLRRMAEINHLDLHYVDLFIKCMGVYPVGSLVQLNSKRLAIVESKNANDPIRPNVRAFFDKVDNRYIMTEDLDLTKEEDFIVKGVRADDFNLDMNKVVEFLLMQG
jgi:HD-GYP domain-containing protein (c-di-GMP phosphodiesterase class II)